MTTIFDNFDNPPEGYENDVLVVKWGIFRRKPIKNPPLVYQILLLVEVRGIISGGSDLRGGAWGEA